MSDSGIVTVVIDQAPPPVVAVELDVAAPSVVSVVIDESPSSAVPASPAAVLAGTDNTMIVTPAGLATLGRVLPAAAAAIDADMLAGIPYSLGDNGVITGVITGVISGGGKTGIHTVGPLLDGYVPDAGDLVLLGINAIDSTDPVGLYTYEPAAPPSEPWTLTPVAYTPRGGDVTRVLNGDTYANYLAWWTAQASSIKSVGQPANTFLFPAITLANELPMVGSSLTEETGELEVNVDIEYGATIGDQPVGTTDRRLDPVTTDDFVIADLNNVQTIEIEDALASRFRTGMGIQVSDGNNTISLVIVGGGQNPIMAKTTSIPLGQAGNTMEAGAIIRYGSVVIATSPGISLSTGPFTIAEKGSTQLIPIITTYPANSWLQVNDGVRAISGLLLSNSNPALFQTYGITAGAAGDSMLLGASMFPGGAESPQVVTPTCTPGGGTTTPTTPITLATITPGATGKYTTDLTNPLTSSTAIPYNGPFLHSGDVTILFAFSKSGYLDSVVERVDLVIPAQDQIAVRNLYIQFNRAQAPQGTNGLVGASAIELRATLGGADLAPALYAAGDFTATATSTYPYGGVADLFNGLAAQQNDANVWLSAVAAPQGIYIFFDAPVSLASIAIWPRIFGSGAFSPADLSIYLGSVNGSTTLSTYALIKHYSNIPFPSNTTSGQEFALV